jgi:hypothetical protein
MAIISNAVTIADAGAFSVSLGSIVHIKTLTASSSATLSFVHGTDGVVLDSTYPIYKFEFINIHPSGTNTKFQFNMSTDSGSNYNVTKTTTSFGAYHAEDDSYAALRYDAPLDLAQGTGFQTLFETGTPNNEESSAGTLTLFNPSSSVFVKHFISDCTNAYEYTVRNLIAGYGNTTNSVDAIQFKMESGNIDSGKIKLYGIKDS